MQDQTGYLKWRVTYQDSESAARAAYAQMMLNFLRVIELEQKINAREKKTHAHDD